MDGVGGAEAALLLLCGSSCIRRDGSGGRASTGEGRSGGCSVVVEICNSSGHG